MAPAGIGCTTVENKVSTPITPRTTSVVVKPRACPLLLSESNSRPQPVSATSSMGSSMVFDFRGKDVKPQVAVMPSPIRISREELDGPLEDNPEPCGEFMIKIKSRDDQVSEACLSVGGLFHDLTGNSILCVMSAGATSIILVRFTSPLCAVVPRAFQQHGNR